MAKKFFYNKVYNPKKTKMIAIIIVIVAIIGVIACFFIIQGLMNKACENPVIKIKDSVNVEINSNLPRAGSYFNQLQCIKEKDIKVDSSNVDLSRLGQYDVVVTINGQSYTVKVNIVDNTAPELKLKDLTIQIGDKYSVDDFVESCVDNSKEDCILNFYQSSTDEFGNIIDYSKYTKVGNYEVKISAKDSSNNQSLLLTHLSIIEKKDDDEPVVEPEPTPEPTPEPQPEPIIENPKVCEFGDLKYDENVYILTTRIGYNGCAISKDIIDNDAIKENINSIAQTETKKIQSQIDKISGLSGPLDLNGTIIAIPNIEQDGCVGFSLHITVNDNDGKEIVSYNLKEDGTRVYQNNPYNIE